MTWIAGFNDDTRRRLPRIVARHDWRLGGTCGWIQTGSQGTMNWIFQWLFGDVEPLRWRGIGRTKECLKAHDRFMATVAGAGKLTESNRDQWEGPRRQLLADLERINSL